jgi:hypothetical protein
MMTVNDVGRLSAAVRKPPVDIVRVQRHLSSGITNPRTVRRSGIDAREASRRPAVAVRATVI